MSFWPARAQKADHGTALGRLKYGYNQKMTAYFMQSKLFESILKEAKDYKFKAKVGDFWLQIEVMEKFDLSKVY